MSEFINNRANRQKKLKELIMKLHEGIAFEEVKKEFEEHFGHISASEISALEQSIIMEGMPVEEVQRLCNVHSAVFKGSIEEIHGNSTLSSTPGHPLNTFIRENKEIKQFLGIRFQLHIDMLKENDTKQNRDKLIRDLENLSQIDNHYLRKENLVFPYLEKYGIYGPPKVMWGVDDDIRDLIKEAIKDLKDETKNNEYIIEKIENIVTQVNEMIFKEENILFPMCEETLTQDEWLLIQDESDNIGYTFIDKPVKWIPPKFTEKITEKQDEKRNIDDNIHFETGVMTVNELELMLNHMPFDITFIDKNDIVKYFSHGKERIFPRTKAIIGRTVQNCHPPGSVNIVNQMIEDFKTKKKDHEDFWIKLKGMYVYIRYFAVFDKSGEYVGVLEVTQNIQPLQELTGEKRLVTD